MPEIGEIKCGNDLGKKKPPKGRGGRFSWHACIDCGEERWVRLAKGKPTHLRCYACSSKKRLHPTGINSPNWKGGSRKTSGGYIEITLFPDDPYYSMAMRDGVISEHRYIMAKKLGRCLVRNEQVHHIDGDRQNNVPENLELLSSANHNLRTMFCGKCETRKEIRLLKRQVKHLEEQVNNLSVIAMGLEPNKEKYANS